MIEYVLIPKSTLEANKLSIEHTLNADEIQKLIVYKDLIKKFVEQKALSIQFDIGTGQWKGREDLGLLLVDELAKIGQDIGNMEEVFKKYQADIKQKEALQENNLK